MQMVIKQAAFSPH
uniref:Uncharacterized protein n=1 Tax=Anguilla anguilla TaxID=7936 RepID=A0A0E9TB02_ANGAN